MALRRSHSGDENIDPFNAPDPVMPSEEPEREDPDPDDGIARVKQRGERRRGKLSGPASNSYQPPTYDHDDASSAHGSPWQSASGSMDPVSTTAPEDGAGSAPIYGGFDAPVQGSSFGAAASEGDGAGADAGTSSAAENTTSHHRQRSERKPRAPRTHRSASSKGSRTTSCAIYLIIFILLSGAIASGAGMLLSSCTAAVGGVFEGLFEDDGPATRTSSPVRRARWRTRW